MFVWSCLQRLDWSKVVAADPRIGAPTEEPRALQLVPKLH